MFKRTLCLILSAITVFSVATGIVATATDDIQLYVTEPAGSTEPTVPEKEPIDETMVQLAALVRKYPEGKYWNHMGSSQNSPETVTNTPCSSHRGCSWTEGACSCNSFDRSIQCMGYAHKIAYDITGMSPRAEFKKSTKLNVDNLRVGDVIRFRNDGHSICVTGVNGSKISFTDCNWDYKCGIRWGVMDISYIKSKGFTYVLHLAGNDRKNTDLYFFDHIEDYEVKEEIPENAETWTMSGSNLNVRDKASIDGKKVGTIAAGSSFYVTEKLYSADYLWGYVTCGSVKGWAALNYSEYESGTWQNPDIVGAQKVYESYDLTFEWKEVSGANYYLFRLYDADKKIIKQFNVYGETTAKVTLPGDGTYYAKVYSRSSHNSSWVLSGKLISFNADAPAGVKITSISFPASTVDMLWGESKALEPVVVPAESDEMLVWKSSAPEIVSVDGGTLTALSCGIATISCENEDGTVSASCTVTVKPQNITNISIVTAETKVDCITFTWDALPYADSYDIHRYNAETKKYDKIGVADTASFTDTAVEAGNNYYYLVRGCDVTDNGTFRGANTKVKLSTKPAKVTGLNQDYSSNGKIRFVWDEVQNATVYCLYRYDASNRKYVKVKNVTETTVTLSVDPGTNAYYRIYAATKSNGVYLYSEVSDKALGVSGPSKPDFEVTSNKKGTAQLSWSEVDGVYRYYVYRATDSGWECITWLESGVTEYTDTSLKSGTKYTYRVRPIARKGGVTGYGAYTSSLSVKVK